MTDQEGPTEIVLPPRIERHCGGCRWHWKTASYAGSNYCKHPAYTGIEKGQARYLGATDLTPNDCPVLKDGAK